MNCLTKLFQQKRRRIGYILAFSGPMISKRDSSVLAYLLKHNIYVGNDDGTDKELSSEERRNAWKTLQMVDGLENVSYLKSLEDK